MVTFARGDRVSGAAIGVSRIERVALTIWGRRLGLTHSIAKAIADPILDHESHMRSI